MNMSSRQGLRVKSKAAVSRYNYGPSVFISTQEQHPLVVQVEEAPQPAPESILKYTEEEVRQKLQAERSAGFAEAELQLRETLANGMANETARVSRVLLDFETQRSLYFAKVESEVVQLALSIAGRILHREAKVEPMLVAAIVQIALGQLKDASSALIRVPSLESQRWREHFASISLDIPISVQEDAALMPGDCVLETNLGSVNFSLDAQLKEVEQGFFDLLAQKPRC